MAEGNKLPKIAFNWWVVRDKKEETVIWAPTRKEAEEKASSYGVELVGPAYVS